MLKGSHQIHIINFIFWLNTSNHKNQYFMLRPFTICRLYKNCVILSQNLDWDKRINNFISGIVLQLLSVLFKIFRYLNIQSMKISFCVCSFFALLIHSFSMDYSKNNSLLTTITWITKNNSVLTRITYSLKWCALTGTQADYIYYIILIILISIILPQAVA